MLAFLGGTGPEGKGLALRLALASESIIIGSRDARRAQGVADELARSAPSSSIQGAENADAAAGAEVVFLTVPYEGQREQVGFNEGRVQHLAVSDVEIGGVPHPDKTTPGRPSRACPDMGWDYVGGENRRSDRIYRRRKACSNRFRGHRFR